VGGRPLRALSGTMFNQLLGNDATNFIATRLFKQLKQRGSSRKDHMKIRGELSIKAATAYVPATLQKVDEAIELGILEVGHSNRVGAVALPVAEGSAAPEMAILAGRQAIVDAAIDPAMIDLVIHAWLYHQGHELWSSAHFVAAGVGAVSATAFGVQQSCNGGALGMQLGATQLLADPDMQYALVTTGDNFSMPGFNRWSTDYDVAYGDGGTALLLGRSDGQTDKLRILSLGSSSMPELETIYRGADKFSSYPLGHGMPINKRRSKKAFYATVDIEQFGLTVRSKLAEAFQRALDDADIVVNDPRIRLAVLPRVGQKVLDGTFRPAVDGMPNLEAVHLGAETGHLGAGDFLANISDVIRLNLLGPGELGLVLSSGGSVSWTCAVIERPGASE
jgi:3-oxoacyl-[acyl-carrier-protein] synthase III